MTITSEQLDTILALASDAADAQQNLCVAAVRSQTSDVLLKEYNVKRADLKAFLMTLLEEPTHTFTCEFCGAAGNDENRFAIVYCSKKCAVEDVES